MGIFRIFRYLRILGFLFVVGAFSVFALCDGIHKKTLAADAMAKYQKPVTLTCDEFVHRKPTTGWFRVTDCTTDALDATFVVTVYHDKYSTDSAESTEKKSESADINQVMVSAHGASEDPDSPASIALLTKNETLCNVVSEMNRAGFFETKKLDDPLSTSSNMNSDSSDRTDDSADTSGDSKEGSASPVPAKPKSKADTAAEEAKMIDYFQKNAERIRTTRTIEGMVDSVDDLDSDQKSALGLVRDHLKPNFILFEEGQTPVAINSEAATEIGLGSFGTIVIGLIFAAIVFFAIRRNTVVVPQPLSTSTGLYNRWDTKGPVLGGDFQKRITPGDSVAPPPAASGTGNSWSPGRASDVSNPAPAPSFDVFDAEAPSAPDKSES